MLNQEAKLDRIFHALADSGRRCILQQLGSGPRSVTELARPLSMSLPGVVQHVQILEASGLISSRKIGRVRTCRLNQLALSTVEKWILERQSKVEHQLDRLGDMLGRSMSDSQGRDK